ncbi:MAG: hypothetical protein JEY94_07875 [Melioribacteraceae bacterium]|nr:hypothetical protein [Melioribacteraceae bacterium]
MNEANVTMKVDKGKNKRTVAFLMSLISEKNSELTEISSLLSDYFENNDLSGTKKLLSDLNFEAVNKSESELTEIDLSIKNSIYPKFSLEDKVRISELIAEDEMPKISLTKMINMANLLIGDLSSIEKDMVDKKLYL